MRRIFGFVFAFLVLAFVFAMHAPVGYAQTTACTTPAQVSNVLITYPNCQGTSCSLTTALCTWTAVTGAVSYTVTITNTNTNTVVGTPQTITTPQQYTFPVTQNQTYRCDVGAVNSCGTTGTIGTDTLLCSVPVTFTSPTPTVTTTPAPTTPVVQQLTCGFGPCSTGNSCISGLVCAAATNGQSYCTYPVYQAACQQSPSMTTCCSAPAVPVTQPTPRPVIAPTGSTTPTILLGIGIAAMTMISGLIFFIL